MIGSRYINMAGCIQMKVDSVKGSNGSVVRGVEASNWDVTGCKRVTRVGQTSALISVQLPVLSLSTELAF